MLPGMTCVSGLVAAPDLILFVDFYTTVGLGGASETIPIVTRPGFSKARVTCIGPGGLGVYGSYYDPDWYGPGQGATVQYGQGGYGGNCVTSIVGIGSSDSLSALFNNANSYFQIGSSQPVSAATFSQGGNVGDVIYTGAYPDGYEQPNYYGSVRGGAAAGVYGNAVGQTKGSGFTWVRSSDKAIATNGDGINVDYGGGGSSDGGPRGRGLVVVEWGIIKPF